MHTVCLPLAPLIAIERSVAVRAERMVDRHRVAQVAGTLTQWAQRRRVGILCSHPLPSVVLYTKIEKMSARMGPLKVSNF